MNICRMFPHAAIVNIYKFRISLFLILCVDTFITKMVQLSKILYSSYVDLWLEYVHSQQLIPFSLSGFV